MGAPEIQATIEKLDAKPGDTLLVHVHGSATAYDVRSWAEALRALVPAGVKLAIFGPEVSVTVQRSEGA